MTVTVRPMAIDHYHDVLDLWKRIAGVGVNDADTPEGIAAFLSRNPGLSSIALDRNQIIGTVLCGHDGRRGYLHHLAVEQTHRGQGIGSDLVNRCLTALATLGINKCNIMVYADNDTGAAFWERRGFFTRTDLAIRQSWTRNTK